MRVHAEQAIISTLITRAVHPSIIVALLTVAANKFAYLLDLRQVLARVISDTRNMIMLALL